MGLSATERSGCGTRLGIDLGGTKIEGLVLGSGGKVLASVRVASPRDSYRKTIETIRDLVERLEETAGLQNLPVGIGIPGGISKRTGLVHNANSTWLNGQNLLANMTSALAPRIVRIANDANCFTLSEATDGAGAGGRTVFGVILGTGVGGGIVVNGAVVDGPLGIAGEWGHNPLPWANPDEHPGLRCWCGRNGCMETWISGPALAADHARVTGASLDAAAIAEEAKAGNRAAQMSLERYADRLARGLAHTVNILDPEVIVLGGGLSQVTYLYDVLPSLMRRHIFADAPSIGIKPPKWGDASGVRGAAWLTNDELMR